MTQLTVSLFNDRSGSAITALPVSWADFVANFSAPPVVGSKGECQLFSLCEFGDKRTENGSLRSNDNVLGVWGAVGDYDGEKVQPTEAAAALSRAGVRALVYTSPSHAPHAPRFRVVAPASRRLTPEEHAAAIERLNTIVGGGLSSESFTLSQPYYIGRVAGSELNFSTWTTEGATIDTRADIARTPWRGARSVDGSYKVSAEALLDDLRSGIEIHPAIVALAARGYTQDELTEIVEKHMGAWDRPERGRVAIEQDIPRAVSSWERKKTRDLERMLAKIGAPPPYEPVAPRRSRLFPLSHFTAAPKPLEWLIDELIEHPTFVTVFGESGAGKSYLTVDWAMSIATGRPWQGKKVKQGTVVYLCGEGHGGMNRRYKAWLMKNGLTEADAKFFATERAWSMIDDATFYGLQEDLDGLPEPPSVIVIDTYTRHAPGLDQNSSKEVPEFVRRCDDLKARYGCTVILVAHSGLTVKDRVAGSHTLKGTLDVELAVLKNGKGRLKLHVTKMKDGDEPPDMLFKFEKVLLPWYETSAQNGAETRQQTGSVLVKDDAPPVETAEDTGGMNKAARMLDEILRQAGGWVTRDDARDEFKRLYGGLAKSAATAFNRALKSAMTGGKVIEDEGRDQIKLALFALGTPPKS